MKIFTLVIVGIVAVVLGYLLGKKHSPKMANGCEGEGNNRGDEGVENKGPGLIERQAEEKKRNLEAILELLESGSGSVTNNQVEQMLGISDASAERYLDELEKMGKIRQVGTTGTAVSYEKI